MHERERAIQEQRTLMATKNNLMGVVGKLGTIAKYLGSPILKQDEDEPILTDYMNLEEKQIQNLQEWSTTQFYGYIFDGLSRGLHLEIRYEEESNKLVCYYKGYEVFKEIAGDLHCYAPSPDWENPVEKFYQNALEIQRQKRTIKDAENQGIVTKKKNEFLERLRRVWGI